MKHQNNNEIMSGRAKEWNDGRPVYALWVILNLQRYFKLLGWLVGHEDVWECWEARDQATFVWEQDRSMQDSLLSSTRILHNLERLPDIFLTWASRSTICPFSTHGKSPDQFSLMVFSFVTLRRSLYSITVWSLVSGQKRRTHFSFALLLIFTC